METGYQRGRIQDESMLYEHRKHDGSLPIIGVNTFRNRPPTTARPSTLSWRASESEKESQLAVRAYRDGHRVEAEAGAGAAQGGRGQRGQRLCRPHGRGARLLAAAGDRRLLRGRGQYRRNV